MIFFGVPFFKQVPLFRPLLPFVAGIVLQWYSNVPWIVQPAMAVTAVAGFVSLRLISFNKTWRWRWVQGVALHLLMLAAGMAVTWQQDIRHQANWVGSHYALGDGVLASIEEPLVEKAKSYKAVAAVQAVYHAGQWQPVAGKMLLYFKKDSLKPPITYGTRILFTKPLQPITNSGNPGAFNYQRYSAFHETYHQVFLKDGEYQVADQQGGTALGRFLFGAQRHVLNVLKQNIYNTRELGVAEALLIGYRDDLNKDLVQAYSNTGVVHIIAISGLHLGMIYFTLVRLFALFGKRRWLRWVRPLTILAVLWLFSLVAGGAPSILRSAIMFSCLTLGEVLNREQNNYNTLIASAFAILLWDPFALWDVGFQLSYAAVLSIFIFLKPITKCVYTPNKVLMNTWKLSAVTLSAQVLTVPIVCYYFHQFPNLFLITNMLVVPWSSGVLYSLLLLLVLGWWQPVAAVLGWWCQGMLFIMNWFIEKAGALPFALTESIQLSVPQTLVLYAAIGFLALWLLRRKKWGLAAGLAGLLLFVALRAMDFYTSESHNRVVVYNVPQNTAIDIAAGRQYQFLGDTTLLADDFLQNFHLKPARILHRQIPGVLEQLAASPPFYFFNGYRLLVVDRTYRFTTPQKIPVDMVVLTKNTRTSLQNLADNFTFNQVVFDGSNAPWTIERWKQECRVLGIPYYATAERGALEVVVR